MEQTIKSVGEPATTIKAVQGAAEVSTVPKVQAQPPGNVAGSPAAPAPAIKTAAEVAQTGEQNKTKLNVTKHDMTKARAHLVNIKNWYMQFAGQENKNPFFYIQNVIDPLENRLVNLREESKDLEDAILALAANEEYVDSKYAHMRWGSRVIQS